MSECIQKDRKFFDKFSPGCGGGEVEYPSAMSTMNPKTKRFNKIPGKTCRLHYLESAFGLYALRCPRCDEDPRTGNDPMQAKTDVAMHETDKYTYISISVVVAPARHTWFLNDESVPAFTVRCWNCGFVFWKRGKVTKAMRERNEREFWKQIPEASPKLKKILEGGKKL